VATLARTWLALPRLESRAEPRDAGDWLRANGVTLAAVTLIAIQLWWKADLLSHSYFRQDDFSYLDRALSSGFGWKYLMWMDAGHLLPAGMTIAWVLARVSLYNWPLTCAVTLVLLAGACLALLRMLRTLFGSRPAILVPLAVYLFSPLSLTATAWWSMVIEVLPLELAVFMAVDAHVRYLRGGRLAHAVAAAGWLLIGMASMDQGAVAPLLLLALTSAFFVEGYWLAALVRAAIRYWRAWVMYGAVLVGYCVVFFIQLPGSTTQPGNPGSASHVLDFASTLTGTALLPGLLGGPWRWATIAYDQASPPAALQQLSWAAAAIVVVVSCACRVRAWRAWAILAGWLVVADILPVVLGRLGTQSAALLGAETRYLADATPVLALCIGLAFLPLAGKQDGYRFRLSEAATVAWRGASRYAAGLAIGVFLVGSFWSLQAFESVTSATASRSYIATARVAVAHAPRGTVIVDGPVSQAVMDSAIFMRHARTSQVIGAMIPAGSGKNLSWTLSVSGTAPSLMTFDAQGRLRPVAVQGTSSWPPPRKHSCWPVSIAAAPAGTSIPMSGTLYRWPWTMRLAYSGPGGIVAIRFGGSWVDMALPDGAHVVYVPVVGAGNVVSIRPDSGTALCVSSVKVGTLLPEQAGQAIPAAPVPG
jgi:hypothetical protein